MDLYRLAPGRPLLRRDEIDSVDLAHSLSGQLNGSSRDEPGCRVDEGHQLVSLAENVSGVTDEKHGDGQDQE